MYGYDSSYIFFVADLTRYSRLDVTVLINKGMDIYQGSISPELGTHALNKSSNGSYGPLSMNITLEEGYAQNHIKLTEDTQWNLSGLRVVGYPKLA